VRQNFRGPVFGLLLCLILVSTGRTQNGYTWQLGAQMPGPRQELATGALNGNVYVLGGFDAEGHSTDTVLVYHPTTDTWTLAHPLPYGVNHNSAAVAGGDLYSFGAEEASCLFTIRTPTPGLRELPVTTSTARLRQSG